MNSDREFDILVVGELNIDMILNELNAAPVFGTEQRAGQMTFTLGGSSAIFAANSANLGSRVAFCGKIGRDSFGEYILREVAAHNVDCSRIISDERETTGVTTIINYEDDRMMINYPGAMTSMTVADVPEELIKKCRHLHVSSVFFQPKLKKDLSTLFRRAKEQGLSTSMDTQWDPDEKWDLNLPEIMPNLDFFLPNESEITALTGTTTTEQALAKLAGFDTIIAVKQSTKGAAMQQQGKIITRPAYKVEKVADAIGAGDSFNSGFIYAYLQGKPLEECLDAGNLTAAVSTMAPGGTQGIISYEQVQQYREKLPS